jgi:hypothetical protein
MPSDQGFRADRPRPDLNESRGSHSYGLTRASGILDVPLYARG